MKNKNTLIALVLIGLVFAGYYIMKAKPQEQSPLCPEKPLAMSIFSIFQSEWSDCIAISLGNENGKQTRTTQACSEETNFVWKDTIEERNCDMCVDRCFGYAYTEKGTFDRNTGTCYYDPINRNWCEHGCSNGKCNECSYDVNCWNKYSNCGYKCESNNCAVVQTSKIYPSCSDKYQPQTWYDISLKPCCPSETNMFFELSSSTGYNEIVFSRGSKDYFDLGIQEGRFGEGYDWNGNIFDYNTNNWRWFFSNAGIPSYDYVKYEIKVQCFDNTEQYVYDANIYKNGICIVTVYRNGVFVINKFPVDSQPLAWKVISQGAVDIRNVVIT